MTQLPSLERWALLPFLRFSYPNLLLVFLNLLLLGTCIICFSQVLDFLWVFFILFYFPVDIDEPDRGSAPLSFLGS